KGSFVDFAERGKSRLNLRTEIRNLKLGMVRLFGGLDLAGTWEGREAGFAIEANAHTRSLFINDYELQERQVHAEHYDRVLRFAPPEKGPTLMNGVVDFRQAPQMNFKDFRIAGKEGQGVALDGDIGPSHWDFRMNGQRMDLGVLGGLAGFPYPLSGEAEV